MDDRESCVVLVDSVRLWCFFVALESMVENADLFFGLSMGVKEADRCLDNAGLGSSTILWSGEAGADENKLNKLLPLNHERRRLPFLSCPDLERRIVLF